MPSDTHNVAHDLWLANAPGSLVIGIRSSGKDRSRNHDRHQDRSRRHSMQRPQAAIRVIFLLPAPKFESREALKSKKRPITDLGVLRADDDPVHDGHLAPLLRLEARERGCVVHPEPGRHPPDLFPAQVHRPGGQERRVAVEELHVPVLVLGHLAAWCNTKRSCGVREGRRGYTDNNACVSSSAGLDTRLLNGSLKILLDLVLTYSKIHSRAVPSTAHVLSRG